MQSLRIAIPATKQVLNSSCLNIETENVVLNFNW